MAKRKASETSEWDQVSVSSVEQLGRLMRDIRRRQDLTQEDVAGLAGLGNRFIIDVERGKETVQMQKVLDVLRLLGLELVVKKV